MLLVKLKVPGVTRITGVVLPHARGDLKVAGENGHGWGGEGSASPVHPVQTGGGMAFIVWRAALELAGVHDEVADAGSGEDLINGLTVGGEKPLYLLHRRRPVVGRTIGKFGKPEALRACAEVALVVNGANLDLCSHALIKAEEGKIGVGSGSGDELNVSLRLEPAQGANEVSGYVVRKESGGAPIKFSPQASQ